MNKNCIVILGDFFGLSNSIKSKIDEDNYTFIDVYEHLPFKESLVPEGAYVLSEEAIEPIGGLKSYKTARSLIKKHQLVISEKLKVFTSVTIVVHITNIVGNCIEEFIQWIPPSTEVNIHAITPFSFEGHERQNSCWDIITRLKNYQSQFSDLNIHIYDGRDNFQIDWKNIPLPELFDMLFQSIVKNIINHASQ